MEKTQPVIGFFGDSYLHMGSFGTKQKQGESLEALLHITLRLNPSDIYIKATRGTSVSFLGALDFNDIPYTLVCPYPKYLYPCTPIEKEILKQAVPNAKSVISMRHRKPHPKKMALALKDTDDFLLNTCDVLIFAVKDEVPPEFEELMNMADSMGKDVICMSYTPGP